MTLGKLRVFRRFTLELGLVQNYMLSKCWRLSQWNYSYLYSWVNVYVLWDWKHIWWLPNSNYSHLGPPRRPKAWEMRPDMPLRPEPMLVKGPMSSYSTVIPPNVKITKLLLLQFIRDGCWRIQVSLVSSFLMNPQHKGNAQRTLPRSALTSSSIKYSAYPKFCHITAACQCATAHENTTFDVCQCLFRETAVVETLLGDGGMVLSGPNDTIWEEYNWRSL